MANWNIGGTVNNTASFSGPWGASSANFWYTDGVPMPLARLDLNGNRPIYLGTIYAAYTSGPFTGAQLYYYGTLTGGGTVFGASGSTAQLRFTFFSGGTLYVGRQTGNGYNAVRNRDGTTPSIAGGLVGSVDWGQVPTAPQSLTVASGPGAGQLTVGFAAPSNNGDLAIGGYRIETGPTAAGPWTSQATPVSPTTTVITPGAGAFFVRVYCANAAGLSQAVTSASATQAGGGGRRYDGSSFIPVTIGRKYNGTSWVDLTTKKRYNGTTWTDITN